MAEATHEISACYMPMMGKLELTWTNISSGETAAISSSVSPEQGDAIARVVMACVYHPAIAKAKGKTP